MDFVLKWKLLPLLCILCLKAILKVKPVETKDYQQTKALDIQTNLPLLHFIILLFLPLILSTD